MSVRNQQGTENDYRRRARWDALVFWIEDALWLAMPLVVTVPFIIAMIVVSR